MDPNDPADQVIVCVGYGLSKEPNSWTLAIATRAVEGLRSASLSRLAKFSWTSAVVTGDRILSTSGRCRLWTEEGAVSRGDKPG